MSGRSSALADTDDTENDGRQASVQVGQRSSIYLHD